MIGYINGTILNIINETTVLLLPHGSIGYEVFTSSLNLHGRKSGDEIELYVYHHITEKGQYLFGFGDLQEKDLFLTLLKVNGLGPKGALALMALGKNTIFTALENGDEKVLTQVSGIGPKVAKKIILELKGKIVVAEEQTEETQTRITLHQDIVDALVGMGYDKSKVQKILSNLPEDITENSAIVRYAIKELSM